MRKNIIYSIAICLFTFFSCTEKIDIKLDSSFERIVIEGHLTNEYKTHYIKVTKSADYFSNKPAEAVSGALVTINDGTETFTLKESDPGTYITDPMAGTPGKTYVMNVDINGQTYTAESFMYSCPPTDSISFELDKFEDFETGKTKDFINVLIYAQEPANEVNHYAWKAYKNDTLVTDTLREISFTDDVLLDGSYIKGVEVQFIEGIIGDTITLETQSITKEHYDYMLKIMLETDWDGGPFDGPPANFFGNISNGALGFFAVYSIDRETAIVPKDAPISEGF